MCNKISELWVLQQVPWRKVAFNDSSHVVVALAIEPYPQTPTKLLRCQRIPAVVEKIGLEGGNGATEGATPIPLPQPLVAQSSPEKPRERWELSIGLVVSRMFAPPFLLPIHGRFCCL